jgi:hypothetical protein
MKQNTITQLIVNVSIALFQAFLVLDAHVGCQQRVIINISIFHLHSILIIVLLHTKTGKCTDYYCLYSTIQQQSPFLPVVMSIFSIQEAINHVMCKG